MRLNITEYTIIAENMEMVADDEKLQYMREFIHEKGTHAMITGHLEYGNLQVAPMEQWWKSKERIPGRSPYGSLLLNRKWILNEVGPFYFLMCVN